MRLLGVIVLGALYLIVMVGISYISKVSILFTLILPHSLPVTAFLASGV